MAASLESYVQGGGHVLVTGYDTLGDPTDVNLAGLVRAINPADLADYSANWQVTNLNHFVVNGPYGDYRGQSFTATGYDDDGLTADTGRGAVTLARTPGVTDRIIFTDVNPGGSVGYWNGGLSYDGTGTDAQPDFNDGGNPQNLFLNWVSGVLEGALPQATTQTVNAVDTGWYDNSGFHTPANMNYLCGESAENVGKRFNDWFVFDVPVLNGVVANAELLINCYINRSPSGFETYELRRVATPIAQLVAGGSSLTNIYDDLADGTLYGSRDVYTSESNQAISVPLNAAFLSALTAASGGQIALGGSLSTLEANPTNESVFGYSQGNPGDVQLRITYATSVAPRVALFGAEPDADWPADVKAKLVATGLFADADVDVYTNGFVTPTLSQLQQYAAVLTWSNDDYVNGTDFGNVLADYVDNGGGVVVATFAFWHPYSIGIGGRLQTGGYLPFTTGGQDEVGDLSLVKDLPLHPLLNGVTEFNGGSSSYHNSPITIASNATLVAHWSNGQPLVGTRDMADGRVAGLNFFPPSSDVRSDFWTAGTDGGRLMANALLWAGKRSTGQTFVSVFDNPLYVDSSGGFDAESDNVQASLTNLGYSVDTFTDIVSGIAGQSVVVIPELENGDLAADLTATERAALQYFVQGGGTLVIHGSSGYTRSADLINSILGTSVTESFEEIDTVYTRTPQAAGTSFAGNAATLAALNGSDYLATDSLPPGALNIYSNGTRALVAVLPAGAGRIVFLGWDWFNAMPIGSQDGGWQQVLSSAVIFGGLPPAILTQPADQTVDVGGTATFSVTASGTEPLSYFWRRDGEPVAGATASTYTINNVQMADSGRQFSCLVSNAYGTAASSSATLTVTPISALLIWDINSGGTVVLSNALANAGLSVTLSATSETGYNGANPSPAGFQAVIHLNGTTFATDMPEAGQIALSNYVHSGGCYIQSEWDAYEYGQGRMARMRDLILFDRSSGGAGSVTYTRVQGKDHPVLANVPSNFTFQASYCIGFPHAFSTDPVNVLMNQGANYGAVAVRKFGSGRIVGFSHAGNHSSYNTLSDTNVQRLYINAVRWDGSDGGTTTITTEDVWNGGDSVGNFGEPNTATYGQTFVAPAHAILNRFTVYINNDSASVDFKFYVMAWDGAKATGPVLYESAAASTAGQSGMQPFTFYTGDLVLTPGATYVAFVCASTLFDGVDNSATMGFVYNAYPDGHFVFLSNGADFSQLTSSTWGTIDSGDLAFVAAFAGSAGGGGGIAPLRLLPMQISGNDLYLALGTTDNSPIAPERAGQIRFYATTDLSLPFSSWLELTQPTDIVEGVLWLYGLSTTDEERRFFRAVETP